MRISDWSSDVCSSDLRIAPRLSLNTLEAALAAAEEGWGITRALSYQVDAALAEGRLVELLAEAEDAVLPVHLLHAEGRRPAAKIRSFIDFAATRLAAEADRSEEHTSELQSLMRISYAVFCLRQIHMLIIYDNQNNREQDQYQVTNK